MVTTFQEKSRFNRMCDTFMACIEFRIILAQASHWRHERDWISSSSCPRTLVGVSDWRCLVKMRSQRDQELRALPRSLCVHQRSKMIRRVPTKKKGQRRMTGAAHTVECHQKLHANVPNEREKTNCKIKMDVVYTDGWCKIYADSLSPHSRRQVDSTACVIRSLLALNSE